MLVALLTAVLYAAGAALTITWFEAAGLGPGFFPAAGVSLAVLTVSPRRRWPWLLLAVGLTELVIDLYVGRGWPIAIGHALANTLEPLVGAALLRAAAHRPDLGRRRDLWAFLVFACAVGPVVGGAVAATTHVLAGGDAWLLFAARWTVGDGLGVLLVGGALLSWQSGDPATRRRLVSPTGISTLLACLLASLAVFRWDVVWLGYLLVLLLVAVAFLLGPRGVGLTGLVMATVIGEGSANGLIRTPDGISSETAWFAVNLVVGLVVVVGFVLAVEIGEREESVRRRREAEDARRSAELRADAATERARLLDAERGARSRAELLQALTERLSRLTTPGELVTTVAGLTATALGSRTALLAVPHGAGLRTLACHGCPDEERAGHDTVLAAGRDVPLVAAYRSGGFVSASGPDQVLERFSDAGLLPRRPAAVAAVPVVVDGRAIGAFAWGFPTPRGFDDDFAALATALGAQIGLALERARLFEAQRRHTEHLTALQQVVGLMAVATSTDDVVAAVLDEGPAAVSASSAVLRVLGPDGRFRTTSPQHGGGTVDLDETGCAPSEAGTPLADAVRSGEVVVLRSLAEVRARYPACAAALARSGDVCWAAVPFGPSTVTGGIALGFATPQSFGADHLSLLVTLGRAAGQSLGRAAAAEREHAVAVELQRSLLGRPDLVPGLEVATAYRPGTVDLQIGGDWYDVVGLPGGWAALVIGDVSGHSLPAAVAMGQVRSTLRALATVVSDPAALVERLDDFVEGIDGASLTSLFYAVIDPRSGAVAYSCAGHPPPLVVPRVGAPHFLEDGLGMLLGMPGGGPRPSARTVLEPGATLVLYTDGLIERRGESMTKGMQSLADHARTAVQAFPGNGPAEVCEHLTRNLVDSEATDDTALLVVRCRPADEAEEAAEAAHQDR